MGATELSVLPPSDSIYFPDAVFRPATATDIPVLVYGAVGHTANLQEWRDVNGTILSSVASNGSLRAGPGSNGFSIGQALGVIGSVPTQTVSVIRGPASHSANLTEWQDSAGVIVGAISSAGLQSWGPLGTGSTFISAMSGRLQVQATAAGIGNAVITAKGAAGHTGNLLELQDSTGALLGSFNSSGSLAVTADLSARVVYTTTAGYYGAALNVLAGSYGGTGARGIVVRGSSGQSGNLIELQRSDATIAWSAGVNGVMVDARSAPVDSERLVVYGSAAQTQGILQVRNSVGAALLSVFPAYSQFFSNHYLDFGPNSTWGAKLRIGGNGHSVPASTATASVVTTDGNLHLDGGTSGKAIHLNWYATGTGGVYFGNGASVQVGRVDGGGAASFVSVTSTSRLDTKAEIERVLEQGPDDERLMSLSAVKYKSTLDRRGSAAPELHSFVAEEVEEIMPEIVTKDEDGEIVGINMTALVTILTTQVQNLTARIRELEAK